MTALAPSSCPRDWRRRWSFCSHRIVCWRAACCDGSPRLCGQLRRSPATVSWRAHHDLRRLSVRALRPVPDVGPTLRKAGSEALAAPRRWDRLSSVGLHAARRNVVPYRLTVPACGALRRCSGGPGEDRHTRPHVALHRRQFAHGVEVRDIQRDECSSSRTPVARRRQTRTSCRGLRPMWCAPSAHVRVPHHRSPVRRKFLPARRHGVCRRTGCCSGADAERRERQEHSLAHRWSLVASG